MYTFIHLLCKYYTMKKLNYILLFSLFVFSGWTCKDEIEVVRPVVDKEYFIVGLEYGRCIDDCINYYKLENGKIYTDLNTMIGQRPIFSNKTIESSSIGLFKYLSENIPSSLYQSDTLIGCVHCSDIGVAYIEKYKNGKSHFWKIDLNEKEIPVEMRSFVRLSMVVVNQLNAERIKMTEIQ